VKAATHNATIGVPGRLAQLGEHQLDKLGVTGSSPVPPTSEAPAKAGVSFSLAATHRELSSGLSRFTALARRGALPRPCVEVSRSEQLSLLGFELLVSDQLLVA
jgi:hypothetical protein